jgi:hypothetical protein
MGRYFSAARARCAGRLWIVRVPVLLYFAFVWAAHTSDPRYQSLFKGIDLGIHEVGHILFHPFGDILGALGGSILQCLAPCIAAVMFYRQRDDFAIAFCFGWLSVNFFEVATYAGDAVAKSLHLVTPGGGEPIHDWNYVLASMGWLRSTEEIALLHRVAAHLSMAACLAFGTWLVLTMARSPKPAPAPAALPDPEMRAASFESPARATDAPRTRARTRSET